MKSVAEPRSAFTQWPPEGACEPKAKPPRGSGNSLYGASVISLENARSWSLVTFQLKMAELVLTGKKSQTIPQENSEPTTNLNQNRVK